MKRATVITLLAAIATVGAAIGARTHPTSHPSTTAAIHRANPNRPLFVATSAIHGADPNSPQLAVTGAIHGADPNSAPTARPLAPAMPHREPSAPNRARVASRRSVLTRSPGARSIRLGAATTHHTPAASSALASPKPVGPASYATATGAGNPPSQPTSPSNLAAPPAPPPHPSPHPTPPPTPTGRAHPGPQTYAPTSRRLPVIAALPPRPPRRQPAPTYEVRRRVTPYGLVPGRGQRGAS
jgi:hypothetical protein